MIFLDFFLFFIFRPNGLSGLNLARWAKWAWAVTTQHGTFNSWAKIGHPNMGPCRALPGGPSGHHYLAYAKGGNPKVLNRGEWWQSY